jgi:transcriptional regulator with XRE-family HTH domain
MGRRARRLRRDLGLSQIEMAKRLGMPTARRVQPPFRAGVAAAPSFR